MMHIFNKYCANILNIYDTFSAKLKFLLSKQSHTAAVTSLDLCEALFTFCFGASLLRKQKNRDGIKFCSLRIYKINTLPYCCGSLTEESVFDILEKETVVQTQRMIFFKFFKLYSAVCNVASV